MSQKNEFTLLEYARFHGLAYDYLNMDPLANLKQPDNFLQDLEGIPDDLSNSELNGHYSDERLSFGKEAISLLASITILGEQSPRFDEDDEDINPHPFRKIKCELPMLRTDHILDMRGFAVQIVPELEQEFLPLEKVDEEADEGLGWPIKYSTLPEEFAKKFQSERLQVSTDILFYLRDTLKSNNEGGNFELQNDEVLKYKRNTAVDPVTPPLLPLTPPLQPFEPSSDAGNLELLSDHTSPTRQELHDADRLIFGGDAIIPQKRKLEKGSEEPDPMLLDFATVERFYSPLKDIRDPQSSSPRIRRACPSDQKIEGPLTPLAFERSPPWVNRNVPFNDALRELIPQLPLLIPNTEETLSPDIDVFFAESIEPIATKAERKIEQEQLLEADTTRRVSIPIMDFSLPQAPWKGLDKMDESRKRLRDLKKAHLNKTFWPVDGKSERELSWVPFPASMGRSDVRDEISETGLESRYLTQPEETDSSSLIWKRDGLRILDDLASPKDEELEHGSFKETEDLNYLVRKRKLEMEEESGNRSRATGKDFEVIGKTSLESSRGNKPSSEFLQVNVEGDKNINTPIPQDLAPEPFSAMSELDKFMCIRKGETHNSKQIVEPLFPVKKKTILSKDISQSRVSEIKIRSEQVKCSVTIPSLPLPQTTIPSLPHPFVVSASFLRSRKLARRVQNLYPAADFIERDFTMHSSSRGTYQADTKLPSPEADTMADEADIIVSPSTGLILTTLQKIKQRPLPGQPARLRVHERILRASPRYERLLIMITKDYNAESTEDIENQSRDELTNSDWEAVAEFMGFCSSLHDDSQSFFIAGGQEQHAHWIVAMMVKYGMVDSQLKLLQDETLWEIFLRRAGLNAFAAQCILAELKPPDREVQDRVDFGLAAFVRMPLKERLIRFEGMFGGRNLLIRVSRRLDARW